jgi:hypothetical protein
MKKKMIWLLLVGMAIIRCSDRKVSNNNGINLTEMKPRIVVLTDVSSWETDDSESLVRLFAHADLFEIEGIIFTTGWSLKETRDDFFELIHMAIDAYENDLPNLMKRSGQSGFSQDDTRQAIGYWPSADYLRNRTMYGSKGVGIARIGRDNISDGSNLIVQLADENDERPVWMLIWGGGNTVAQAIWQVQQERSEAELKDFLKKIPVYAITDQDMPFDNRSSIELSSHQWMRREFEKELLFIWDECAWKHQNNTGRENWDEYEQLIQTRGNLGKVYPKYKFGVEGDTPSFFHVMPNGLNNPLIPGQIGWAGYFEWAPGPDEVTYAYTNQKGEGWNICTKYFKYFYPATFNNFAARMDWAHEGKGNRNPVVIVNGIKGLTPVTLKVKPGQNIELNASESLDPDGDELNFKWWIMPEAGTYKREIQFQGKNSDKIAFTVPSDSAGETIHIICEVYDNGSPVLTGYRRIIIDVTR